MPEMLQKAALRYNNVTADIIDIPAAVPSNSTRLIVFVT